MFPALNCLNLDNNNISEVSVFSCSQHTLTSHSGSLLSTLSLSQWGVVDELAKLPSLVKLCCRGNRLLSSDGNLKTANQLIIAKLGQLVFLDNCEVR